MYHIVVSKICRSTNCDVGICVCAADVDKDECGVPTKCIFVVIVSVVVVVVDILLCDRGHG